MTASKSRRQVLAWLTALALLLLLAGAGAQADPRVTRIDPVVRDGMLHIDADVHFDLNDQLRDAAERGLTLYFTADVVITRSRWYWFDEEVVNAQMTRRIVYNALTRQWRVGGEELSLPVATLAEAMATVSNVRGWAVAPIDRFEPDTEYQGQFRLRLDTSQLARPFQVNALNSSSWSPATNWADFSFSVRAGAQQ
ncbi:DUF4390 domain-containing protein [Orrella sp. JC864]|uniref:DUF4390 domain-containing protein n=1 Tax=Orrella sp. JC864 TaxID=3120298 RepID=UPI00300A297F